MLLKFDYKNWRGDEHSYVIEPDEDAGLKFTSGGNGENAGFVISGDCISRDGKLREGAPRRTFRLLKMRNLEETYSGT